jgi:cell division septation protein DedD
MISLLLSEGPALEADASRPETETAEFEFVLGRRQMAGVALVVTVLVAVFSGVSYTIGKTMSPAPAVSAPQLPVPPVPAPLPVVEATIAAAPLPLGTSDGPLFAEPVPGAIYLQIGAVEKGVAQVWAEGLRTHGLHTFVASGPSEKIFRVLVGPFRDQAGYQDAKKMVDDLGLANFAKRIQP